MKKIVCALIIPLMMAFHVTAQNLGANSGCITNPPNFSKLSYEEASQSLEQEERKQRSAEYITNLVEQIRNGQLNNDNKTLAIYLLGAIHPTDTNSIEVLIENINFKASRFDPADAFSRWGLYPAKEALIKIGKSVVDPILNHLPTETSELRRKLMCEVLRQVERREYQKHIE